MSITRTGAQVAADVAAADSRPGVLSQIPGAPGKFVLFGAHEEDGKTLPLEARRALEAATPGQAVAERGGAVLFGVAGEGTVRTHHQALSYACCY